jgi:DENN (AEX-3) domain
LIIYEDFEDYVRASGNFQAYEETKMSENRQSASAFGK